MTIVSRSKVIYFMVFAFAETSAGEKQCIKKGKKFILGCPAKGNLPRQKEPYIRK